MHEAKRGVSFGKRENDFATYNGNSKTNHSNWKSRNQSFELECELKLSLVILVDGFE